MYQNVPYKRVFVTIDLDAIVFNMESMKQNIKPGTEMMGVVKADGYGHGSCAGWQKPWILMYGDMRQQSLRRPCS